MEKVRRIAQNGHEAQTKEKRKGLRHVFTREKFKAFFQKPQGLACQILGNGKAVHKLHKIHGKALAGGDCAQRSRPLQEQGLGQIKVVALYLHPAFEKVQKVQTAHKAPP